MRLLYSLSVLILALSLTGQLRADNFTAAQSGNWGDASTWSGGVAPPYNLGDNSVTIPAGITVVLHQNLTINQLFSSVDVNGTLEGNADEVIYHGLGVIGGTGTITIDRYTNQLGYAFDGSLNARVVETMSDPFNIPGDVSVMDTFLIQSGSVSSDENGTLHLVDKATLVLDEGQFNDFEGSFSFDGNYNVSYVGEGMHTGKELDSATLINTLTVDLDQSYDDISLSDYGFFSLSGDLVLLNGNFEIHDRFLLLGGDIQCNDNNFLTDVNTQLIIGADSSISDALRFDLSYNEIGYLGIDFEDPEAVVELATSLRVEEYLVFSSGNLNVVNGGNLEIESDAWITRYGEGGINLDGSVAIVYVSPFVNLGYRQDVEETGLEANQQGIIDQLLIDLKEDADFLKLKSDLKVRDTATFTRGGVDLNAHDLTIASHLKDSADLDIVFDQQSSLFLTGSLEDNTILDLYDENSYIRHLEIDLADQSREVALTNNLIVTDTLSLQNGNITTNHDLNVADGAFVGGGFDAEVRLGDSATLALSVPSNSSETFPVSKAGGYTGLHIENNSASDRMFAIGVRNEVLSQGQSGYDLFPSGKAVNKTWDISSNQSSNIDISISLEWEANMEGSAFDRTEAFISHYDDAWQSGSPEVAGASGYGTFMLSKSGITELGVFSVQNSGATGLSRLKKSALKVYPNPVSQRLNIDTRGSNINSIKVQDMTGKTVYTQNFSKKHNIKELDLSGIIEGVYMVSFFDDNEAIVHTERVIKR